MPHADTKRVVHKETIGFLVCNEDQELTQARARGWYLATRCTVHVCNSRDMFVDYEPVTSHEVLTLENDFHILTITKYLISVVKLTDIGFSVSFGGDQCAINKGRNVIGKGYKEDGLYWLSVLEENSGAKVVHNETISLMVCNESPELTKTRARGWVLSITCTVHVCNSRDMFLDYHPLNGHEANVVFGGHVKLLGKLGQSNLITNMSMSDEGCVLMNGDELVGIAYKEGGLLRLSLMDERQDGIGESEIDLMIVVVYAPQEAKEKLDGFDKLVRDSWNVAPVNKKNAIRNFMGKLKFLKDRIRSWLSIHRSNSRGEIYFLKEELRSCDEVIDKGDCSNEVVHKRTEILNKIHQVNNIQASEIAQKAKIKWAIEGDENVKFFHGMLNKKRNQSNIQGIMVNGTWVDDPVQV
ncbi:hypothetical protein Tco_0767480, partial [Tanacetum coccineum]